MDNLSYKINMILYENNMKIINIDKQNLEMFYLCNNIIKFMCIIGFIYYIIYRKLLSRIIFSTFLGFILSVSFIFPKCIMALFIISGSYEFFFHWENSLSLIKKIILWNFIYIIPVILVLIFNDDIKIVKVIGGISMIDIWSLLSGKILSKYISWKPKIISDISPNKTFIGYLIGGIAGKIILVNIDILYSNYIIISAMLGDLLCSLLKRKYGVSSGYKDFGFVLGSHGGILDRIDSHLLGVSVYCLINLYFI
jgi:CDP-diglyceride synthetase